MIVPFHVIREAQRWIGTPFQHQARAFALGCDCSGLVIGVGRALGLFALDFNPLPAYPYYTPQGVLRSMLELHFINTDDHPRPGTVALIRVGRVERHCAIVTSRTLIHSHARIGRVVEHSYDARWRDLTTAVFEFPGVTYR